MVIFNKLEVGKYLSRGSFSQVYSCGLRTHSNNNNTKKRNVCELFVVKNSDVTNYTPLLHKLERAKTRHIEHVLKIIKTEHFFFTICAKYKKTLLDYSSLDDDPSLDKLIIGFIRGIEYIHKMNLVHCDIKRNNLMLDAHNNLVIIDLNNIRDVNQTPKKELWTTLGERHPKLVMNNIDWSFETDLWAFGSVLYEIFYNNRQLQSDLMNACDIVESRDLIRCSFNKALANDSSYTLKKIRYICEVQDFIDKLKENKCKYINANNFSSEYMDQINFALVLFLTCSTCDEIRDMLTAASKKN